MASEAEIFSYEDKSWKEREFDRDFGYYTEKHPNHEYRIKIKNESTITEYVFNSGSKLKNDTYTLDEMKSIMTNTYRINVYDYEDSDFRKYTNYYKGMMTGKGSEIKVSHRRYHPEDDGWIRHGICYEYYPYINRIYTYQNGKTNGWEVEKFLNTDEITERLFEDSNCLGYRIKKNGIITKNTISDEDFEKYGEPPSISDA